MRVNRLVSLFRKNRLKVPESTWTDIKKERLIESILIGLPIGIIIATEDKNGVFHVEEGASRVRAILEFGTSERFETLPPRMQNKFEDTPFSLYIIDYKTPREEVEDILSRYR